MADKRELIKLLKHLNINYKEIKPSWDESEYNYNFDNRLRIQKIVYILSHATKQMRYDYSLYLRGPYSSSLANDYYNISDEEWNNKEELNDKTIIGVSDLMILKITYGLK